jgi:hypothetical protein
MLEPGMSGAGIKVLRQPQLADSSQSLEGRVVNNLAFPIGKLDKSMYGVSYGELIRQLLNSRLGIFRKKLCQNIIQEHLSDSQQF